MVQLAEALALTPYRTLIRGTYQQLKLDWALSVEPMNRVGVEENMTKIECSSQSARCRGEILGLYGEMQTLRSHQ